MADTVKVTTPVGDFEWVIISGNGKESMSGAMQYTASVVLGGDTAESLKAVIDAYWDENHPKEFKKPKSTGYKPHFAKTDKKDEDGKWIMEETGKTIFQFKTGVAYADGKAKVIKVFNSSGAEVQLGDKKIGNGSRGRIQGSMGIYEVKSKNSKKATDAGVTLYLDGVQISKFVEYQGGPNFDAIEDESEEGGWEGPGEAGAIPDETGSSEPGEAKVRL